MVKLSVHILTYNSEAFISRCLNSIIGQQTNFPYEIVIGDDASTDKTVDIINSYTNIQDKIKLKIHDSNLGVLNNFIDTLQRCNGKYIFDIAGDDWLSDPYALQTLVMNWIKIQLIVLSIVGLTVTTNDLAKSNHLSIKTS